MKKILTIISIILLVALIGFGIFYFFGNGKEKVSNFFSDNTFGSFFDANQRSQNEVVSQTQEEVIEDVEQTNQKYVAPILRHISLEPVSGYTYYSTTSSSTVEVFDIKTQEISQKEILATSTAIRFQERATGHIYDVFEFIASPQKVSNITEQKVYETIFSNNANEFIFKKTAYQNEQVETSFAKLIFSTTTDTILEKRNISNSVVDFIFNKNSNKLVYTVTQSGVSSIFTSNIDRTNEKISALLPFNEYTIDTINANEVLITTKASQVAEGYSYTLNTNTGVLTKILGKIPGLVTKVNSDKTYALYSESNQNWPSLFKYDMNLRTSSKITLQTLPSEKCVFSKKDTSIAYCFGATIYKSGQYPDDWYKGKAFNYESLYKVNLEEESASVLYSFFADDLGVDGMNVQLTDNEQFIIFQNKFDLTLWSIDLIKLANELN